MIRHPLHSAVGRARPGLCRVTDGFAASLRQFSVSAQRCNPDDSRDDGPRKPTGRQRAAAAVDEIVAMEGRAASPSRHTFASSSGSRPEARSSSTPPAGAQGPKIITLTSLPRGGLNRNAFRKVDPINGGGGNGNGYGDGSDRNASGPNIIRGGFRGRGGSSAPSYRIGGAVRRGRSGGGGGGGNFNRDDRPRRSARAGGGGGGRGQGRGPRGRRRDDKGGKDGKDDKDGGEEEVPEIEPRIMEYLEAKETGTTMPFNPSLSLESLTGWGPAVATSGTPFGQGEIVMRQARILGGGQHFHPQHIMNSHETLIAYRDGNGAFIPPSNEAKQWAKQVLKDRPIVAPPEVKTAVLEDALLGKYDGPKYADPEDAVGTIRSYVKRDGTWNVRAERGIEEKVKTLLSGGQPAANAGGKEARPKA
ncbi:hypothetical protein F5Y13DRAFT_97612 [Hypoxylon sp. FL1857]|nr:hypothetical protein F5Y13DRAFT_97612 [Hypoxylon sp. FL1857]